MKARGNDCMQLKTLVMNPLSVLNKKKKMNIFPMPGYEELINIPGIVPQRAGEFIPKWIKSIPTRQDTIKDCPVIPEYISQGIIIPMWCDMYFMATDDGIIIETPSHAFKASTHGNNQFLDYIDSENNHIYGVVKLHCPWLIETPKNTHVYQLPTTYHFNGNFSVMPGSIRTDVHYQINQQVLLHKKDEWIFIQKGTPLVQYIPYINKKVKHTVGLYTKKQLDSYKTQRTNLATKFFGAYKLTK